MELPERASLARRGDGGEAQRLEQLGRQLGPLATPQYRERQGHPIHADVTSSDRCSAEGFTVRGSSPVLAICRRLVAAGFDTGRSLIAFRGEMVCLVIRSIGEGAALTIDEHNGTRFAKWKPFSRSAVAPPVRQKARAATPDRNRPPRALAGGTS